MPTILVVDDDLAVLKLFGRILEKGGYSVRVVSSVPVAIDVLREANIDLLVLDLSMPGPDGFDLLKELRTTAPSLGIVVVSGYLQGALLKAAELVGAVAAAAGRAPAHTLPEARLLPRESPLRRLRRTWSISSCGCKDRPVGCRRNKPPTPGTNHWTRG